MSPKLYNAIFAAIGDIALYYLTTEISSNTIANFTLVCHVFSWSLLYCLPRSLANSTEMNIALYMYWLTYQSTKISVPNLSYDFLHSSTIMSSVALATYSVYIRPTSASIMVIYINTYIIHCLIFLLK